MVQETKGGGGGGAGSGLAGWGAGRGRFRGAGPGPPPPSVTFYGKARGAGAEGAEGREPGGRRLLSAPGRPAAAAEYGAGKRGRRCGGVPSWRPCPGYTQVTPPAGRLGRAHPAPSGTPARALLEGAGCCPSVLPSRPFGLRPGVGEGQVWGGGAQCMGGVVSLPQSGGDRSGARKAEAPAQRGRVPHMDRIKVPSGDPASPPPRPARPSKGGRQVSGAPESPGALFPAWVRRGEGGSQCLVGPGEVWDWVPPKVHAAAPFRPHLRTQGRGWTVPDSAANHGENVPSRATPSPLGLNNQLSFFSHLSSARISSVPVLVSSQPFFRTDPCCHYMNKTWPREDE